MKKATLLIALLAILGIVQAQNRVVRVHSNGQEVYSLPAGSTSRMFFNGSNAVFFSNGDEWATPLRAIDSITFALSDNGSTDTTSVNDSTGIVITWNGDQVTIQNPCQSLGVSITNEGGHVTVNSTADSADLSYILRGSSTNGSLTMTTAKKVVVCLDGVSLTNPVGPALNITSDKRAAIHLRGTSSLCDGASNTLKAALQCRGRIDFQGSGTLQVTGLAKHAIQSSGRATVLNGTIQVLGAVSDGMNVDIFVMEGGSVTVSNTGSDGIDADQGYMLISGGSVDVTCNAADVKGLCADSTITLAGGNIHVVVNGDQSKAIKTKHNMTISAGTITIEANGTLAVVSGEPSYCTGIKVDGDLFVAGGNTTITCPSTNAGGKAISVDGNVTITSGVLTLNALGECNKYSNATGTYSSYSSTCIKSNANVNVNGGALYLTAGGRGIGCDGTYTQNGGIVNISTSANGFTTIGSGTSCTDGFSAACLKADGDIRFVQGTFSGNSTGLGGRGIAGSSRFILGQDGASDSLLTVSVQTSGLPVNATSGGGWGGGSTSSNWKGLPKGVKIQDSILIYSGHLMSYCSQPSGDPTAEAIETKSAFVMNGGIVEANSYDDAINSATYMEINGGRIWAYSRGNDAIDNNGSYTYINGGLVIAQSDREMGFDASTDAGGHFYITGGTVVAKGSMGAWDTPTTTGANSQHYVTLGSSGGWGGSSGTSVSLTSGFCIKQGDTDIMIYKADAISGSGFETGTKPPPGGGSNGSIAVCCPAIATGNTYTLYTSPTITGGTQWHGLYDGATCTTSGSGTTLTVR